MHGHALCALFDFRQSHSNNSLVLITAAEAETPKLWPLDAMGKTHGKRP